MSRALIEEACAGCGVPLGTVAHLYVQSDATGGPTGRFHLSTDCYGKARSARLGQGCVSREQLGGRIAPGRTVGAPGANWEAQQG